MTTLTQPLNRFISEQVNLGVVHSEKEAELTIMVELEKRELDRGIKQAQEEFKKGDYVEFDDDFLESFLKEKREQYLNKQAI